MARVSIFKDMPINVSTESDDQPEDLKQIEIEVVSMVDDATTVVEFGKEISETIEETGVVSNVQSIMTQGDLSVEALMLAKTTLDGVKKRLSAEDHFTMPALESFTGNKHEARGAYSVSMEGIGSFLARIWRAIKNAFISLWEKIKELWHRMFGLEPRLRRSIKSLEDTVKSLKSSPEKNVIQDNEISSAFSGKNITNSESCITILDAHTALCSDVSRMPESFTDSIESYGKVLAITKEQLKSAAGMEMIELEEPSDYYGQMNKRLSVMLSIGVSSKQLQTDLENFLHLKPYSGNDHSITSISINPFINGRRIALTVLKNTERSGDKEFIIEMVEDEPPKTNDVQVLLPQQMSSILNKANKLLDSHNKLMNQLEKTKRLQDNLIDLISEIEKLVQDMERKVNATDNPKALLATLDSMRNPINSLISALNYVYTSVPMDNIKAVQMAVRYVDVSCSEY